MQHFGIDPAAIVADENAQLLTPYSNSASILLPRGAVRARKALQNAMRYDD
jgi:hypothetical protein